MASLFFISSCEKPTEGLGFEQVIGGTIDADSLHIKLISYTAPLDSVLVALDYSNQLLIGGYNSTRLLGQSNSSYFGQENAAIISQLYPEQFNADFGTNPIVDSVFLFLRIADAYGDTTVPMNISVKLLEDGFSEDSAYYSNYAPQITQELGRVEGFLPMPGTSVKLAGESSPSTLKISLDLGYFQSNFADVGDGEFEPLSTFAGFSEYFKGIKVEVETGGAILSTNLGSAFSVVRAYYHNDDDTTFYDLSFDQDKSIVPIHFSTFSQDYSGSSIETLGQDSVNGENQTYVQSMGGVCTAIKFDPNRINEILDQGFIINRATVDVFTAQGTGESVAPSSRMEIRRLNGTSLGDRIIDFQVDGGGDGNIRRTVLRNNRYSFDITRHLFEVLNSGENPTLALVPVIRTTAASRTILRGGSGLSERATVIVYYTKP